MRRDTCFCRIEHLYGMKSLPETRMYWSKDKFRGVPTIQKVMLGNRFEKICQYFSLNNHQNMLPWEDPGYDKLFKVHPLLNTLSNTFHEEYQPSKFVSVDEGMVK